MTISLLLVLLLVVGHFVADFVCQNDWMALNKSKDVKALGTHVLVYSIVMALFAVAWHLKTFQTIPMHTSPLWTWVAVNAAAHFVQDAITSRWTTKLWFIDLAIPDMKRKNWDILDKGRYTAFDATVHYDKRHWFFVVIGLDQMLHYVTLFVTAAWWL